MSQNLGTRTLLEIPHTHYAGENMWLIKAINLCQGKCIQIVHNYNQMIAILKQFQKGVDFNFTEKVIENASELVYMLSKMEKASKVLLQT